MYPINEINQASASHSKRPELRAVSDAVDSPRIGNQVNFGSAEREAIASAFQKLKEVSSSTSESSDELLDSMLKQVNDEMRQRRIALSFSVDEASDSVVVQVVDSESGKVVRQIPPDEVLALKRRLESMTGMLFDTEG